MLLWFSAFTAFSTTLWIIRLTITQLRKVASRAFHLPHLRKSQTKMMTWVLMASQKQWSWKKNRKSLHRTWCLRLKETHQLHLSDYSWKMRRKSIALHSMSRCKWMTPPPWICSTLRHQGVQNVDWSALCNLWSYPQHQWNLWNQCSLKDHDERLQSAEIKVYWFRKSQWANRSEKMSSWSDSMK